MRHREVIEKMTLEEKASLMSGKDYWQSNNIERLEINSMYLADGSHGIRKQIKSSKCIGLNKGRPATCFPTAATIANSWNEKLAEKAGIYLGIEAIEHGINVVLGPAINIKRNPLCGRNFEYFSEDPYLAGKLAASYIRGIQSNGVGACVKHFAVNNQEEKRMSIDTVVDERTLREIYLTAFEIAVKEGNPKSLMSSYNKINGIYANEHMHLMKDILRDEWGFKGCVITDWGGSNDRIKGLLAGNELEMPSTAGETNKEIVEAIKSGRLKEEVLDNCVDRLLDLIFSTEEALKNFNKKLDKEIHHRAAQRVAEESIVLLKNEDNILPIKLNKKVAVIGNFAKEARYQGAGSSIVNPTILDHTLNCFEESGIVSIGYAEGFNRYGKKDTGKIRKACDLAEKADVVLLYIGLDEYVEVEGLDRNDMKLPDNQIELLEELYKTNKNIVAIISCGTTLEMPWLNKVKAVLHGYLGGQAGSRAILRILSGDVNPSGKLAETYPIKYEDTPSYENFPGKEASVEYREGIYTGYRYYDTVNKNVLFPFGYGLSYTRFEYSDIQVNSDGVSFSIKNLGETAGMEISQLYISCKSKKIFRPKKELKGFNKIFINPGDSKRITIKFDDKTFRYFNVKTNKWEIETAEYEILIGASSADIRLKDTLFIEGTDANLPYEKEKIPSYFTGEVRSVTLNEFENLLGGKVPNKKWDRKKDLSYNDTIDQCRYAKGLLARLGYYIISFIFWGFLKTGRRDKANIMIMSVFNMTFRGLSRMSMGAINTPMLDGILLVVNGKFLKGILKIIKEKKKLDNARKNSLV